MTVGPGKVSLGGGAAHEAALIARRAARAAGFPQGRDERIEARAYLGHDWCRSDEEAFVGQSAAELTKHAMAALRQVYRTLMSLAELEQCLDFGTEEQPGRLHGLADRIEHKPEEAAGRVDPIGDAVSASGRNDQGLAARGHGEMIVGQVPARFARLHEDDLDAAVLLPGVGSRHRVAELVVAKECDLGHAEIGPCEGRLLP